MSSKKVKVDYRIKLLSGNNVVLVEADGYESEIFIPEISNGRINFQNIIPNRRCCSEENAERTAVRKKVRPQQGMWPLSEKSISPSRTWRLVGGDGIRQSPRAFSTPAPAPSPISFATPQTMRDKENIAPRMCLFNPKITSFDDTIRTSKIIRRPTVPVSHVMKSVRIQCDPITINSAHDDSGFNIPEIPRPDAIQNLERSKDASKQRDSILTPSSATKWRKCLTPVRTYSKTGVCPSNNISQGKKSRPNKKAPSTAPATKATHKVDSRRRKLIVDQKTTLTPVKVNGQQQLRSHFTGKVPPSKTYEVSKPTAFELLTCANRARVMAAKLEQQFKKACINKASSTCEKYKLLCEIPPPDRFERHEERKKLSKQLNSNKQKRKEPQSLNISAASKMERACTAAIQKTDFVPNSVRI